MALVTATEVRVSFTPRSSIGPCCGRAETAAIARAERMTGIIDRCIEGMPFAVSGELLDTCGVLSRFICAAELFHNSAFDRAVKAGPRWPTG